jgi:RNase H-fold protein (predicted Holliday junction resolvase)
MPIDSDISPLELIEENTNKKEVQCDKCERFYKNINTLNAHKCTSKLNPTEKSLRAELEKRIKDLQSEFHEKIQEVINQKSIESNTINNTNNTQNIKTIDNSNHHNTQNNITQNNNVIIINDIKDVLDTAIQYIVKDPNFVDKVLNWVSDKNGMLKYMDEKFYNSDHPENQMIRRLDKDHMELHTLGRWIKYDNAKAVELIIRNLGLDWSTLIVILKYDYSDDYDNNKQDILDFKRNISDPLDMGIDITDDEDDTKEQTKQLEQIDGKYVWMDVKDEKLVKKEEILKKKIINHVKTKKQKIK